MDATVNHWMVQAKTSGTTAETLWNDAKEYFMWCENNPIFKQEVVKQTGLVVNTEYPRPFNLPALCLHCGVTVGYIVDMSKNRAAGEYHLVCQKIMQVIYSQNLEYAMVGIFNANVTAKKLGLGEDSEKASIPSVIQISVIKSDDTPALADNEFELEKRD